MIDNQQRDLCVDWTVQLQNALTKKGYNPSVPTTWGDMNIAAGIRVLLKEIAPDIFGDAEMQGSRIYFSTKLPALVMDTEFYPPFETEKCSINMIPQARAIADAIREEINPIIRETLRRSFDEPHKWNTTETRQGKKQSSTHRLSTILPYAKERNIYYPDTKDQAENWFSKSPKARLLSQWPQEIIRP